MSAQGRADALILLKVTAQVLPFALLAESLAWFLCWGGYWWPEVFPWLP